MIGCCRSSRSRFSGLGPILRWLLAAGLVGGAAYLSARAGDSDEVESQLSRLASEDFAEREDATRRLDVLGEKALPRLRRAAVESRDVEVRHRADDLVRTIEKRLFGPRLVLTGHKGEVNGVALSANGRTAVSAGDDGTVRIWDLDAGKEMRRFNGHSGQAWTTALSPDETQVLAGGGQSKGGLRLWESATGKEILQLKDHPALLRYVAFLPDGKRAMTVCFDSKVRIWDLATGKELRVLSGHKDIILSLALSPDGKLALSGGGPEEPILVVWEVESGRQLYKLTGHSERILGAAISPDGRLAASGSWDGTVRLWDLTTGKEKHVLRGHQGQVFGVVFAPDGKRLASGGQDGMIRFWDTTTGESIFHPFEGHVGAVHEIRWGPAYRLLSCGADGTLRVWIAPH
jgi:WD40 repeat protein